MAGIRVTVRDDQFKAALAALAAGTQDASPLMKRWGEIGQQSISQNFEVGGRPTHWQPLSTATINTRIRGRTNLTRLATRNIGSRNPFRVTFLKPLVVTGTLRNVTVQPDANSVTFGSNPSARAYAAIQHLGGQAGRGLKVTIPARPYLLLQPEDEAEMAREAEHYIEGLLR